MSRKFYVYKFSRPNGVPCYIGLSRCKERPAKHLRMAERHTNKIFANIIKKYGRDNLLFNIVKRGLTKAEAVDLEIELIAKYGRRDLRKGSLANLTDGGEGTSGVKPSEAWLARRREIAKAQANEPERKEAFRCLMIGNDYKRGKPNSELWRRLTVERMTGNTNTLGLVHTASSRRKMSIAGKGRKQSPEHVAKRVAAYAKTIATVGRKDWNQGKIV